MWTTAISADYIEHGVAQITLWGFTLSLTSLIASMTVNALATGLIVFRIFKVFRDVKYIITSDEKSLGLTGGWKLRSIIFIIIESGMALFAIQLARLIIAAIAAMNPTKGIVAANTVIVGIHEMINVTISSVIVTLCLTDNVDLARV